MKNRSKTISFFALLITILFFSVSSCQQDTGFSIRGTVQEIVFGKDGYTATVRTEDKSYQAVISKSMLQGEYKELHTGDIVTLTGDTFRLDNMVQIRVRTIKF
ncbi:MAG: hypothetical protein ABIO46_04550 [Chitinophagales bacterium]